MLVDLHKEISDNDGEALDSLMDGQSHRARLQAQIRASGGQAYVEDGNRKPSQGATNGGHGHTPEGVANSHGRKDSFQMSRYIVSQLFSRTDFDVALGVLPRHQHRRANLELRVAARLPRRVPVVLILPSPSQSEVSGQ